MIQLFENLQFNIAVLATSSLFILLVYLGLNKKRTYFYFFLYSAFLAISLIALSMNLQSIFYICLMLSLISLATFFMTFFNFNNSVIKVIFFAILLTAVFYGILSFEQKAIYLIVAYTMYLFTLMYCTIIVLLAMKDKRKTSVYLFFMMILLFIANAYFLNESFFIIGISVSSILLIISLTFIILIDIKAQNETMKKLELKTANLENIMLKKFIQPHFLVNTLTVISEWIESKPELAQNQIKLLSKEFRYITKVSNLNLIDIKDELEICQVHLDMFNAKQFSTHHIKTIDIKLDEKIPPLIFHTLIENGLTHANSDDTTFSLEAIHSDKEVIYKIKSYSSKNADITEEGLGLSYVKSKLEQAYPSKWDLNSISNEDFWLTEIRIKK